MRRGGRDGTLVTYVLIWNYVLNTWRWEVVDGTGEHRVRAWFGDSWLFDDPVAANDQADELNGLQPGWWKGT